jgi:hypothetical protein
MMTTTTAFAASIPFVHRPMLEKAVQHFAARMLHAGHIDVFVGIERSRRLRVSADFCPRGAVYDLDDNDNADLVLKLENHLNRAKELLRLP